MLIEACSHFAWHSADMVAFVFNFGLSSPHSIYIHMVDMERSYHGWNNATFA
jgi:hypothetical protein